MSSHDRRFHTQLLAVLATIVTIAVLTSSSTLREFVCERVIALNQIQNQQAQAKLAVLRSLLGADGAIELNHRDDR